MKKNRNLVLLAGLFATTALTAETSFDIGLGLGYKHVKETWNGVNTAGTTAAELHGVTLPGGAIAIGANGVAINQLAAGSVLAENKIYGATDALSALIPMGNKAEYKDSFLMISIPMQMKMDRFGLKLDLGYGIGVSSKLSAEKTVTGGNAVSSSPKTNKKSSLFEASLKAFYDFEVSSTFIVSPFVGYEIRSLKRKMNHDVVAAGVTRDRATIADSLFNIYSPNGQKSKQNTPSVGVDFKFSPNDNLTAVVSFGYAMPSVTTNGTPDFTKLTSVLGWNVATNLNTALTSATPGMLAALPIKDVHKKRASQFRFGLDVNWMINQAWALNLFANARTLTAKQTKAYAKQGQGHWSAAAVVVPGFPADQYAVTLSGGKQEGKFKSNEFTFGAGLTYKF